METKVSQNSELHFKNIHWEKKTYAKYMEMYKNNNSVLKMQNFRNCLPHLWEFKLQAKQQFRYWLEFCLVQFQ